MTSLNTTGDRLGHTDAPEIRRPDVARPEFHGHSQPEEHQQNVGQMERLIGGIAGVAMVYLGLKRASLPGLLVAGLGGALVYRSTTGYCPAYGMMGIDTHQETAARPEDYFERGVHVEQAYMIQRPVEEVYHFWRDFSNLPTFMDHLQKVEVLSSTRSRWTAKAPLLGQVSWEAEIIHDQPHELIAWKSVEHSTVANAGTVTFKRRDVDGQPQTEIRVVLDYIPPAGAVGKSLAQMFGQEPSQTIREDLRKLKMRLEAKEVATTEGQPKGTC
jgi:uncharacterized membrane protein